MLALALLLWWRPGPLRRHNLRLYDEDGRLRDPIAEERKPADAPTDRDSRL